jgi:hypothetical protein
MLSLELDSNLAEVPDPLDGRTLPISGAKVIIAP